MSLLVLPPPPQQAGLYRTVYVDPPWPEHGGGRVKRGADRHYRLMKLEDIYRLPVGEWAAPDAHCYAWVTNNYLPAGLLALQVWGFRYVTKIDWFKGDLGKVVCSRSCAVPRRDVEQEHPGLCVCGGYLTDVELDDETANAVLQREFGLGQYFRGVTESCLFGVRGRCEYRRRPDGKRAQGRTGFHARRTSTHSEKPRQMVEMIELVSHGPYLEMFARSGRPGWDSWGDQVPAEAAS